MKNVYYFLQQQHWGCRISKIMLLSAVFLTAVSHEMDAQSCGESTAINFQQILMDQVDVGNGVYHLTIRYQVRTTDVTNDPILSICDEQLRRIQIEDSYLESFGSAFMGIVTPPTIVQQSTPRASSIDPDFNGTTQFQLTFDPADPNMPPNNGRLNLGNDPLRVETTIAVDATKLSGPMVTNVARVNARLWARGEINAFGMTICDPISNRARFADQCEEASLTFNLPIDSIGITKSVEDVTLVNPDSVQVTYRLTVQNLGNQELQNIVLLDNLVGSFCGAFTAGNVNNVAIAPGPGGVNALPTLNPAYDGSPGTLITMPPGGNGSLMPGELFYVDLTFTIHPGSAMCNQPFLNSAYVQGRVPGAPDFVDDLSDSGTDPTTTNFGAPGDTGGGNDPTPLTAPSSIELQKTVDNIVPAATDGNYLVTYRLMLRNTGAGTLTNLQITENFQTQFGAAFVGLTSPPTLLLGESLVTTMQFPNIEGSFSGGVGTDRIFDGSSGQFIPGDSITVELQVEVDISEAAVNPLVNQATGMAVTASQPFVPVMDASDDGIDENGNNNPTPLPPIYELGVAKAVTSIESGSEPGKCIVTYTVVAENTGTDTLVRVRIRDNLMTQIPTGIDSARVVPGSLFGTADIPGMLNENFTGDNTMPPPLDSAIIFSGAELAPGQNVIAQFRVYLDNATVVYPSQNSAVGLAVHDSVTIFPTTAPFTARDSSENGLDASGADINDDGSGDTPTPLPRCAEGFVAKEYVIDSTFLQHDGFYNITYNVYIQNTGTDTLTNLTAFDNLVGQFGCAFRDSLSSITIIDSNVVANGGVLPLANPDFTGADNEAGGSLLADDGSSRIPPQSEFVIQFSFAIDPDCKGAPDPLTNSVVFSAEARQTGQIITDLSDDGNDPSSADNGAGGGDDPTLTQIAGLGVSKMVMSVQPGVWPNQQVVEYLIQVQNTGNVRVDSINLIDNIVDQYTSMAGVAMIADSTSIVPGSFVSDNATTPGEESPNFNGMMGSDSIIINATLESCEKFEVKIRTVVDLTMLAKPDSLANSAVATGIGRDSAMTMPIDSSENGDNPDGSDVDGDWNVNTPTPLPTIGGIAISKLYVEDSTELLHNGFYAVTYCLHVQNVGTDTLSGLSVMDNILDFGCAYQDSAFVTITDSTVVMLGGTLPTLAADFTGAGPGAEMLNGDGVLPPWAKFKIEVTLQIDPDCEGAPTPLLNQATASASTPDGGSVTDLSDDGIDPIGPNEGIDSTHDDPTRTDITAIGVSKELSECTPIDSIDGNYLITYTFRVQNTGNQPLDSVELEDPILDELMGAGVMGTAVVVPGSLIALQGSNPGGIGTGFTGEGPITEGDFNMSADILDGTATMDPGDILEVQVQVEVDASIVAMVAPYPDTLYNSGMAFANDTSMNAVMDSSENALLPNGTVPPGGGIADGSDVNGDWNVNTPTPLKPLPAIGIAKRQISCTDVGENRDGNVIVTFEYVVKNIGSSELENIQVIEDFSANENLGTSFIRVVADSCEVVYGGANPMLVGAAPTKDPGFDGAPNDIRVFDGVSGMLFPGDSLVVTLAAEIDPNLLVDYPLSLPIENSADAEGEFETVVVDDESAAGTDAEGGDSAIVVHAPAIGLLKQAIECTPDTEDADDQANMMEDIENFDVTYKYTLVNVGTDTVMNLQIADTLVNFFGPAFVGIEEGPMVVSGPMTLPVVNAGYDATPGMPNFFDGMSGVLAPGDSLCVTLIIEVDPNAMPGADTLFNSAISLAEAPGLEVGPQPKPISDVSDNQGAEGGDDPTGIGKGDVNITKDITGVMKAASGVPGNVDASFKLVVKNLGNVALVDITIIDDIERLLGPAYVGVVELPTINDATTEETPAFGAFPPEIAIGSVVDSLAPNDSFCVEFTLELDPNAEGAEKVLKNYAIVVAEDAFGTEYQDTSDAGYLPETFNTFHPDDATMPPLNALDSSENDPLCLWLPSVGLAKKLLRVQPPTAGIHQVQKPWQFEACYQMVLENTGNTDLDSVKLVDTISESWGGVAPEGAFIGIKPLSLVIDVSGISDPVRRQCFEDALNIAYDGTPNNPVILMPDSCHLECGERIVIDFKVEVSAKYGPEDDDLINQAHVWGRGIRPAEAATKPGEPVTVLDYDASVAAGMQVRDTVWTHDLSDAGLDPESYNEDDPFDMGTADDPTVLPNCWKNACDLTCVGHIEKPLGQDCEVEVTATMALKDFDQVCVDLGFYNVVLYDPTGVRVPNNTITRDMTRFSHGPYSICVNNIVCPEQFCCTELNIREIKQPWIEGALDTTVYCIDPFLALAPTDAAYPKPEVRPSCEGLGVRGPIFDFEWIEGNLPCESPYSKIIYRIWYATDPVGEQRAEIYDRIKVLKLPELTEENIWCPENVDLYCGDELADCSGPRVILPSLAPMGGDPDTLCLAPGFDTLTGKCGVFVKLLSHDFNGSECPSVHREVYEIKQTCFNPNIQALPAPEGENGGVEEIGDNYFECTWWRTVYDTLDPWIECVELYDTVPTGSHECAAHVYLNDVQVSDECSEIKAVKAEVVELGLRTLMDSIGFDKDTKKVIYGNHRDMFKLSVGTNYTIVYEAIDQCHNSAYDTCYIYVKDLTDPVVVVDKGISVSLSDKKVWVNAEDFDEGTWDNCGVNLFLARRADWYSEIACVDLCDDVELCYASEHHDSLWTSILEDDKSVNEVEAHYAKFLEWMKSDGTACGDLIYNSWMYDLIKHTTINCPDHPYDLTSEGVHKLIVEADAMGGSDKFLTLDHKYPGDPLDIYSQIGGGWSDAVPFSCEDACGSVTVEVIAFDYWCNWSTGWVDVWVEDKTPINVVKDIVDGDITCKTYKTKSYDYPGEEHPVGIDYIVSQAVAGSEDAYASLDEIFGGYCKAWLDDHGNYVDEEGVEIDCDIEFIDSSCFCKDTMVKIKVYDEHLGYIWKDSLTSECGYNAEKELFQKGIVQVNCGQNAKCAQDVWLDLDHCGQGYIYRKFKIWQECSNPEKETVHIPDTIYRHQRIFVGNDCELDKGMFEMPYDTTIEVCGIEYDPEGSGNVVGVAGPEGTGAPKYLFDDDCRIVGVARQDKVFKVVGGDEGCLKIIRTWYFADWCKSGTPADENWFENDDFVKFKCEQKILVIDTQEPVCMITVSNATESGSGTADDPAEIVPAGGCLVTLSGLVDIMDPCGDFELDWEIKDLKTEEVIQSGNTLLEGMMSTYEFAISDIPAGEYKFQVRVIDECQNESYCDYYFNVGAGKKPGPVCVTSLTTELTPWDSNQDGTPDTAKASIAAILFESSSLPPCGESYDDLMFKIEWTEGSSEEYDPERVGDTLHIGCAQGAGTHSARLWVVSPSGTADYCEVYVVVLDNTGACGDVSGSSIITGMVTNLSGGEIDGAAVSARERDGDVVSTMETSKSGSYTLGSRFGTDLEVQVVKDGDDRNGVSTLDLIAMQRHLLGKAKLSGLLKEAADVSNDDRISAIDLVQLRKLILGMDNEFSHSNSWRFYSVEGSKEMYEIADFSDQMELDWKGVKIGDLNLDYDPRRAQGRSSRSMVLEVRDEQLEAGTQYRISITASEEMKDLLGYQYTMRFDPNQIRIVDIDATSSLPMSTDNFGRNHIDQGKLTVSWHDIAGSESQLSAGDVLYSVVVEAKSAARLSDLLTLSSEITRAEAYNGENETMDVSLKFVGDGELTRGFELHQNRPNPFQGRTMISFSLPESQRAVITVFDATGRSIQRVEQVFNKGYNALELQLEQVGAQGILYYQLDTKDFTASRKMTMMN